MRKSSDALVPVSKERKVKVTLVAQTPYQLLSCMVLAMYSDADCHLWLVDGIMERFIAPSIDSSVWAAVRFVEKSGANPWEKGVSAKFRKYSKLRQSMDYIREQLSHDRPDVIAIGSDNHELTAYFAQLARAAGSKVVLFEEGSTVHQSPYRRRASFSKGLFRSALGVPNPSGYSIGWSPSIDLVVVSDSRKAHPEYLQGRHVINWPKGPYPADVMARFLSTFGRCEPADLQRQADIVYLGSPMQEEGWMQPSEESALIESVTSTGYTWIKPHHFDSPLKYDSYKSARIVPDHLRSLPAEVLFHFTKPKAAVSVFSSAGINYATRYGRSAIFILPQGIPREIVPIIDCYAAEYPQIRRASTHTELSHAVAAAIAEPERERPAAELEWRNVVRTIVST